MKNKLIVFIICVLFVYVFLISYADGYGTNVEYFGNATESYTVTVPAKMIPNGYGDVIVEGEWASNRIVNVTADEEVELVNSINVFNKKKLDVNFLGISANGNDLVSQKLEEMILVGDFDSKVLFGEWNGIFNYNVEIVDDMNYEATHGMTYARVYQHEDVSIGYFPLYIVTYKDNSSLFVFDGGHISKTEPDSIVIENNYLYFGDWTFILSDDKLKATLIEPETNIELASWEVIQSDDVIDSTLPINLKIDDLYNNTKFNITEDVEFIRFSDMFLGEKQLLKLSAVMSIDGVEVSAAKDPYVECMTDKFCVVDYGNNEMFFSIKEAHTIFDSVFVKEPGLYFINGNYFDNLEFELFIDEEDESVEWNTLDVKNNKSVNVAGTEFVKISENINSLEYYNNSYMDVIVDGNIVNYGPPKIFDANGMLALKYFGNGFNGGILVVSTPGTYDGVEFDEIGIYAFNYGKYDNNYTINIGQKKYSPNFKNNLVDDVKYVYGDYYYTFFDGSYTFSDGTTGSYDSSDRTMHLDDCVGIVSKDGKSIKLYKYLSSKWIYDEDVVTFVLDE